MTTSSEVASSATAHFATYEDLSSRLVLLPFNDDDCTGAKVCSHEISGSSADGTDEEDTGSSSNGTASDNNESESADNINSNTGGESEPSEDQVAVTADTSDQPVVAENSTNNIGKRKKKNKKKRKKKQATNSDDSNGEDAVNGDNINDNAAKETAHEATEFDIINESSESQATTADGTGSTVDDHPAAAKENIGGNNESKEDSESIAHKAAETSSTGEQAISVGYVLVKLTGKIACMEHSVEQLEEREFTEILSLLRDVAYPITLTFVSPDCVNKEENETDENTCSNSLNAATSLETNSITDADATEDTLEATSYKEDNELNNNSMMASREEAAKYAAQAASELRGRLSRWGYQAVTKATEAAHAVQEIREERQRKMAEEQEKLDSCEEKKCDASISNKGEEEGSDSHIDESLGAHSNICKDSQDKDRCNLFLQSATGFVQLNNCSDQQAVPSSSYLFSPQRKTTVVTNMSVIVIRLSEETACPIGNNGYKFQWYRSKDEHTHDADTSTTEWIKLHGASYPAYQPSVSDIGYTLCCVVDVGNGASQRCVTPLSITTDQSLFESAKSSLLKEGHESCVTFSSLKDATGNIFRLKISVEANNETDSIASSSILLDQMIDDAFEPVFREPQSLANVTARCDPSRPRGFEIVLPSTVESNRRLKLDAPTRNARESLLIALGLASFTGTLSSLSAKSTLLPYSDEFVEVPTATDDENTEADIDETKTQSNTSEPSASAKNLYVIQLEAQMKEMQAELDAKASVIAKLQEKINTSNDDKKKIERELMHARSKADDLLQCERKVEERDRIISEQERTIKSLNNEKAVLAASIEMRNGKLDTQSEQINVLEKSLADALQRIEDVRKHEAEQVKIRLEADKAKGDMETAAVIAAMKKEETQFQQELKAAQSIIEELNEKYAFTKDSATKSQCELERLRIDTKKLKMERTTFKTKAESLSKEMSKLQAKLASKPEPVPAPMQPTNEAKIRTLTQKINQLQMHNSHLQDEVISLRSEKRDVQEELQATRIAHEQSTRYISVRQPNTPNRDASRALQQCEELESIISNMTDELNAKEMQINTLKVINETLFREIDDAKGTRK